jgi:hypothetical protein
MDDPSGFEGKASDTTVLFSSTHLPHPAWETGAN